jgi:hypothetical protein
LGWIKDGHYKKRAIHLFFKIRKIEKDTFLYWDKKGRFYFGNKLEKVVNDFLPQSHKKCKVFTTEMAKKSL